MPEDKRKTGNGIITDVSDTKTLDSGRQYRIINIGAEKFSCWLPELFGELEEGMSVQFHWTPSKDGKWKNIVDVESDGDRPQTGGAGQASEKEIHIIREACLKAAGPMINIVDNDPTQKAADAITIAGLFEEWVWRKKSSEPEPPEED